MLKYDYLTRPAPPETLSLAAGEQEEQMHGREYDWLAWIAYRVRWWRGALIVAVVVACIVLAGMLAR
jgi:hypothetical protein